MEITIAGFTIMHNETHESPIKLKGIKKFIAKTFNIPVKVDYINTSIAMLYVDKKELDRFGIKLGTKLVTIAGINYWTVIEVSKNTVTVKASVKNSHIGGISFNKLSIVKHED